MSTSNSTVADAPTTDAGAGILLFTATDIAVQVSINSTVASGMCTLCILLSSRHLYAKVVVSKLPLIASFFWFISALFVMIATAKYGTTLGFTEYIWPVFLPDLVSRSALLWFTYLRTMAVWSEARWLKILPIIFQAALISGMFFVFWEQRPASILYTKGDITMLNAAVAYYAATDLLISVIDVLLIGRLWVLNRQMTSSLGRKSELVKPLFFYFSIVCMMITTLLSVAMAVLVTTDKDPYFGYNTLLFAFRILFTDIFSNLMRDSLIEARAESASRRASLATGSESRPMNDATFGSKSMSAAPAKRLVIKASHAESG
ncbi:hypothetical protein BC831DRAFT_479637 [Entophlyctis helioformis]|nr:hypothetical protein BC831DRAFT_479637 [Entophlyctis helioformis]